MEPIENKHKTCNTIRKLQFALVFKILVCFLKKETKWKPEFIDSLPRGTAHAMINLKTSHLKTVRWESLDQMTQLA